MSRELLQQALDALIQPHPHIRTSFTDAMKYGEKRDQVIAALEAELAKPKQEPFKPDWVNYRQGLADGAAQPEPKLTDAGADTNISRGLEPKGSGMVTLNQVGMRVDLKDTPPRKEWVGLTDDEQYQIVTQCGAMSADWQDFVVAVEQTLKDKNEPSR
jgi:hypothetical protein